MFIKFRILLKRGVSENLWRWKNVVLIKLIFQILAIIYEALANLACDFEGGVEMQSNAL